MPTLADVVLEWRGCKNALAQTRADDLGRLVRVRREHLLGLEREVRSVTVIAEPVGVQDDDVTLGQQIDLVDLVRLLPRSRSRRTRGVDLVP